MKSTIKGLALAAGFAATPFALLAQTRPDSSITSLPAVSVTATGSTVKTSAMPVTVSVFDREQLIGAGISQVADVLRLVPGATVISSGSFGGQTSLFLRGGESDYVKVLVDGVPLNSAGGAFDFGQLTLDNVERVEVVRGPASVLYGSDAMTGVIQIFTRTGSRPRRVNALAGGGTYGTTSFELGTAGGTTALGWSLDGARHNTNGILPYNNQFRNEVVSGALRARGARADINGSLRWTDYQYHFPTNSSGALTDSNAFSSERRVVWSGDAGYKANSSIELRGRIARNQAKPKTTDLFDNASDKDSFVSSATDTRTVVEGRFIAALRRSHTLTLSAERSVDEEKSQSHSESAFGPFDDSLSVRRVTKGLAAQLVGNLSNRMSYTIGGRRDDNSEFGMFSTGRIAAAYRLTGAVSVRASAGTAFKEPTFFENFATGFTTGNHHLVPERSRMFEGGIQYASLNKATTLSATAFGQRFTNLIQYVSSVAAGQPNYQNLASASANGLELEAGIRLGYGLVARGSYTYQKTKVLDAGADSGTSATFVNGERLLRRPTNLASVGMRELRGTKTAYDISLTYTGARDDRDFSTFPGTPVVMKAFTRVDVSTNQTLPRMGGLSASMLVIRVENALNKKYEQVLGFRAPGRTFFVGLRVGE